ncbi:MAG: hypothetical protein NTX03_05515 [Bacteroidetes bacterium]|nr:hypothetical protein [Bacteroidota bacterium]
MESVTSIEQLKTLANRENGDFVEFYLLLAGGMARSSKRISYRPNEEKNWLIINEIDDSYQELIDKNLSKKTLIVEAIEKGAFFLSDMP